MAGAKQKSFAVVALTRGGPIGKKMRREGDVFMASESEFSTAWMRKATKDEIGRMTPDDAVKGSYDNGTVDRLTGELKAMKKERDKALGELAECQNKLDDLKAGKTDTPGKPDGGGSGSSK